MNGPAIRLAGAGDGPAIARIVLPVVRAGETYALDPAMSEAEILAYWLGRDRETFVAESSAAETSAAEAEEEATIVGTYYLRANQAGGGAHVANCGFMTAADAGGRGIARRMCEHALTQARDRGFSAMQFNFVVATNVRAVGLWHSLGFDTVGRLPGAFRHPRLGPVDALVMLRTL